MDGVDEARKKRNSRWYRRLGKKIKVKFASWKKTHRETKTDDIMPEAGDVVSAIPTDVCHVVILAKGTVSTFGDELIHDVCHEWGALVMEVRAAFCLPCLNDVRIHPAVPVSILSSPRRSPTRRWITTYWQSCTIQR